jgi:hypothetical protein
VSTWMLRAVTLTLIGGSIAVAPLVARQAQIFGRMVKIDGKTDPDRIPEWLSWQQGFRTLATLKKEGFNEFRLALEATDAELVENEALAQLERDEACRRAQYEREAELSPQGATLQEIIKEQKVIVLGCRTKTLEARDKLLAALSPDGQFALLQWIERRRANIGSFVPEGDLEYFKLPRE